MAAGDHIRVQRPLYWHHGIDLGDGTIIHASGEPGRMKLDAEVRRSTKDEFLRGGTASIVPDPAALDAEEIVQRAAEALGGKDYNLLFNNCEHFATWCQTGRASSDQVNYAAVAGAVVGLGTRVALRAIAQRGSVAMAARLLPIVSPVATTLAVTGAALAISARWLKRNDP